MFLEQKVRYFVLRMCKSFFEIGSKNLTVFWWNSRIRAYRRPLSLLSAYFSITFSMALALPIAFSSTPFAAFFKGRPTSYSSSFLPFPFYNPLLNEIT